MSETVEIARRVLAANRSGPPEETRDVGLSLVDPEVEVRSRITAVEGADYSGLDGIRRYYDDLADSFHTWRNDPEGFVELSPDAVLVDNTFRGIGRASGMEVELRSAIVFVVSEGKAVRILSYPTRKEALEAAGLSK
jgi:ketosteroid isomerase-like protein